MLLEDRKIDENCLNRIDSYITTLKDYGVLCTTSEEERYTYCMCFLKTLYDVGLLKMDDAIRISNLFKQQCLTNLIDKREKDSFCKDVETYNEIFSFERKEEPLFIIEKMRIYGLNDLTENKESIYVFYAVSLWEDNEEISIGRFEKAVSALYDNCEKYYGYNPFIYDIVDSVLVSCKHKFFDAKYRIPSFVTKIAKGAFSQLNINESFIIPDSVEEIEIGSFMDTVFDDLVFADRESLLYLHIDSFERITIKSGQLHIPKNVRLDHGAIKLNESTVVYFEPLLESIYDDQALHGLPIDGCRSASIMYVIRDDLDSKAISKMVHMNNNHYLFLNEDLMWLAGQNWFSTPFESYTEYIRKSIHEVSMELDLLIVYNLEFVRDKCIPILNCYMRDSDCYRLIRGLRHIHWVEHENIKCEILRAVQRFDSNVDFSDEFFYIEEDYLVDYIPNEHEKKLYVKIPEGVLGIRTDAFDYYSGILRPDGLEGIEILYLPTSLIHLEPKCIRPLYNLKMVYYHFECDREEFIENYLLSEFDKKMSRDTSNIKLINDYKKMYRDTSNIKLINDYDNLMSIADESVLDISDDTLVSCNENARGIINIPEGIHNVADNAFENCCYITEIHFPKSISYIGNCCFDGCGLLGKLVFDDEASFVIEPNAWKETPMLIESLKDEKVIIYGKTLVLYRGKDGEYSVPPKVHFINKKAFAGRNMKKILFDGDIEYIGDCAFAYNEELYSIELPSGLKKTGVGILDHCPLFKLVLPNKFCITEEDFRSTIGDPRIGERIFLGYQDGESLDVYIDDNYCDEGHSFEYEWSEGYWDHRDYKVKVIFHPRSALNDSM